MLKAKEILFNARDTEPALWNSLKLIIRDVEKAEILNQEALKEIITEKAETEYNEPDT